MYEKPFMGQIPNLTDLYQHYFGDENGFFVDAGAFDGYTWSNTYTLAKAGWKGVMIEPHPEHMHACQQKLKGLDVSFVEMAVSKPGRVGKEMIRLNGSVSTIAQSEIDCYGDIEGLAHTQDAPPEYTEVGVTTLDEILIDHDAPVWFEVLSLDVEGSEIDALHGFKITHWHPKMVIVEAHEMCKKGLWSRSVPINDYFAKNFYVKIYCDHINNIYIRGDLA